MKKQFENTVASVRLDKWLWAARFYKTRALATDAINGGKVHLNGSRVKPSRNLNIGDFLEINLSQYEITIEVRILAEKRGPASFAQTLYQETQESLEKREQRAKQNMGNIVSHSKPSKKDRRDIRKFKGY